MAFSISAMLTSLPLDFASAVRQAAALGFRQVDMVGQVERPAVDLEALADAGVVVSCAAVGRALPVGAALDAAEPAQRRQAIEVVGRQLDDAARLGATRAYVVPGLELNDDGRARFADSCRHLVAHAADRRIRFCVEHVPGRALPTGEAMLDWLEHVAGAAFLLDLGHCLMSGEDAAALIVRAGRRLGHVHCDDNDGVHDLHWPLLTGRLTETMLRAALAALEAVHYDGPLALELNPQIADPIAALREGKELLDTIGQSST